MSAFVRPAMFPGVGALSPREGVEVAVMARRSLESESRAVADEMVRAANPGRVMLESSPPNRVVARAATLGMRRALEVPIRSPVHTPRFSLRMLELADRDEFVRVLGVSGHVDRFLPLRHPGESPEACFARHLATARNGDASGRCWRRVAVDGLGRIVGGVSLINIERSLSFRGDATWWVAGDVLRQGIGTECVYAMLDLALGDAPLGLGLGLHEVHAHVQTENEPSMRIAARVGMRPVGSPQTLHVGESWLLHQEMIKSVLDRA